tara:strand:+ start:653 stop:916 length:264 start_codon:yes stop_codon:yes gene_type:complete
MDRRQEQRENLMIQIEENECIIANGLDHAIIGVTAGANMQVVYSSALILHQYLTEGMNEEDALDVFYFDVVRGNPSGDNFPVFLLDF